MLLEDRTESTERNRPAAIASLGLVLALLPACSASAGHGLFRRPPERRGGAVGPGRSPTSPIAPRIPCRGPRRSYLSNYAGANYPSVAPGAVVSPTDFRVLTGRPVRPWWAGLGQGGGW